MKINNLKLKNIVKNYEIEEHEFEYAGTNGIAELLGWQIVFFRKNENLNDTIAIAFNEITSTELINISNFKRGFGGYTVPFWRGVKKYK